MERMRSELLADFAKITRNYRERRWETAELDGGRLCEVVCTILERLHVWRGVRSHSVQAKQLRIVLQAGDFPLLETFVLGELSRQLPWHRCRLLTGSE